MQHAHECARVDGRQALRHGRAAVETNVRQPQVVQQPLQDVQKLCNGRGSVKVCISTEQSYTFKINNEITIVAITIARE